MIQSNPKQLESICYNHNSTPTDSYRSIKCEDRQTVTLMCKQNYMQQHAPNQIRDCFLTQSTDRML